MKKIMLGILILTSGMVSAHADAVESARGLPLASIQREPISLPKAVGDSDVLLIGDDHTQTAIKTFVTDRLHELRGLGYRCLAVEMLPTSFQKSLDRWDAGDQERIRQHLSRYWGEKGAGIPESLFHLIASAKREGLMVTALDPDVPLLSDRDSVNAGWVECVHRCLIGKGGGRMIVFGGSGHFQARPGSALSLLKAQDIRVSLMEFSSLESQESLDLDLKTAELLGRTVPLPLIVADESRRLGWTGPFMVHAAQDEILSQTNRWILKIQPDSPQVALNHSTH